MLLISNKGNTVGINIEFESTPDYIDTAILQGYCVKLDVWCDMGCFYLRQDRDLNYVGASEVPLSFFTDRKNNLYCECMNTEALVRLSQQGVNCFYNGLSGIALISNKSVWVSRNDQLLADNENIVIFETSSKQDISVLNTLNLKGVCSNYIKSLKM